MRESIYICDRCGEQMKDPYVTIEPKVNSNIIYVPEEYHYCVNCWSYVKENLRSSETTKTWIKNMRRYDVVPARNWWDEKPWIVTCEPKVTYTASAEWTDKDNLSKKSTWTKDSIH